MLLVSMIAILFIFSLLGMEIAWAIGLAAFGYLTLAQFTENFTPMVLFAQQMTSGEFFCFISNTVIHFCW